MKLFMDWWLGVTSSASIALIALDHLFAGAAFGLLSEVGWFYVAYRSRMLSIWIGSVWWTLWWGVLFWRNWP